MSLAEAEFSRRSVTHPTWESFGLGDWVPDATTRRHLGGISVMSLWNWRKYRAFPPGRLIGGKRCTLKSDIIEWENAR